MYFYINKAFDEQNISIKINCKTVNNLRFTDDKVILAITHKSLEMLINRIVTVSDAMFYLYYTMG